MRCRTQPGIPLCIKPPAWKVCHHSSKQLIKQNNLTVGIPFKITIRLDPHNGLRLPEELAEVFDQDEIAYQAYKALTDGHKRGLIHYINQAKSVDSRIKRSLEIMEKIKQRS